MASERIANRGGTPFDGVAHEYHESAPVPPIAYVQSIVQELGLRPGNCVVELGCGSGGLASLLTRLGMRVTGVDCCRELLQIARTADDANSVEWTEAYAEEYTPNTARQDNPDLVLSYEAFHLFSDKAAVVARAVSYVKAGGSIAIGWSEYHWESVLRDVIVAVFAEFGLTWGQWGYQACPEFVDAVEARGESFASVRTRFIRVAERTSLTKIAHYLASIGKTVDLDAVSRRALRKRLQAEFIQAVGRSDLSGYSAYWLRWAMRTDIRR